jgi:hypothetical protein
VIRLKPLTRQLRDAVAKDMRTGIDLVEIDLSRLVEIWYALDDLLHDVWGLFVEMASKQPWLES